MKYFSENINNEPKNLDIKSAEKLAMKYYLFFEIIHPFNDGNGRTGRSLFTYLIRKFTEKNNKKSLNYPYIPIARNESGTIYNSDGIHTELGSLAMEFSNKLSHVLKNEQMRKLLNFYNQCEIVKNNNAKFFFNEIWKEINDNNEENIEDLVRIRKELTKNDSLKEEDFREISNEMKKHIKIIKNND